MGLPRYSLEVCCGLLVLLFLAFGFRYISAVFAVGAYRISIVGLNMRVFVI